MPNWIKRLFARRVYKKVINTAILTFYSPHYENIASLTVPGKDEYCTRHGYNHIIHSKQYRDSNLYYAIDRLYCLRDILFKNPSPPDLVWVLNVPALITNLTIPFTQYLDNDNDFFICMERDHVNAGSFVIRRTEWARRWLDMLIEESPKCGGPWFENQAMINTHRLSPWVEHISILSHPSINSFPYWVYPIDTNTTGNWREGHLVLCMPGTNQAQRIDIIKSHLPKVVR